MGESIMLNVDCKVIAIKDSYEQAVELRKKIKQFAGENGIEIPR
jgi:hypothetical protein